MTDALTTLIGGLIFVVCLGVIVFMTGVVFMFFKDALKVIAGLAAGLLGLAIAFGLFLAVCRIALWGFALL
jgi:hypothetical protein